MQINGRTFLVTGGASGLGAATTDALLERGAHVVVADLGGDVPDGATFVRTDVTDESQVARAVEVAGQQDGPFSGVVNRAGIGVAAKVIGKEGPHPLQDFMRVIGVNLGGTFNVIRLAADAMRNEVIRFDGALRMAPR